MNGIPWLALVVALGWISGCATRPEQSVDIPLLATMNNAGTIAQASLTSAGNETTISFVVGGVPSGTTLPVHLYTYVYPGSCQQLGPKPAYAMNQTVGADTLSRRPPWQFWRRVPVALSELRAGDYALVIRSGPMDGNLDLFCGDLR
ncbi:hypothetical protein D3880_17130 [Pseudomonas cavernae]|uniref:Lipoprotein n=1 Tax=Pseudomonas cavernae TaxID=2320867 RepID=A0A385Z7L7_9PSED|nr:hypothetical protein [Pseudomonas cavernae]AYC33973.1 hypothetical protein D3880_17130 [Pseudomonas cavernae]